jgi:CubicO group peptidase (beta-lactamase class C family)
MAQANTPGLSMAIVRDARVAWTRAFGVADRGTKTPVDEATVFEAGSISKTVFAYAVMKLCEKGVLSLDSPLTAHTSERFLEGDEQLRLITPRMVLSHTAGFPNWRSQFEPLSIRFTPAPAFPTRARGTATSSRS